MVRTSPVSAKYFEATFRTNPTTTTIHSGSNKGNKQVKKTYQLKEDLGDGDTRFSTIELTEEQYEFLSSVLPWDITVEEFYGHRVTTLEELVNKLQEQARWDRNYAEEFATNEAEILGLLQNKDD